MSNPLTYVRPSRTPEVLELTYKCINDCFLMTPRTRRFKKLYLGCLGRAQHVTGIEIYAYANLSNHGSVVFGVYSPEQAAAFKREFLGNLAKEVKRYQGWTGQGVLRRRNRTIPLADPDVELARLEYCVSNGTKEHLVSSPTSRVFANSAHAMVTGENDEGIWVDWTKYSRLRKSGHRPSLRDVEVRYEVKLSKPPSLRDYSDEAYQRICKQMVRRIERAARADGRGFLGADRIQRTNPTSRPAVVKKSPAPLCHASSPSVRRAFIEEYRAVCAMYRDAMEAFKETGVLCGFPPGTLLPGALQNHA